MTTTKGFRASMLALLAAACASAAGAQTVLEWITLSATDLVPARLSAVASAPDAAALGLAAEPLSFSWALDPAAPITEPRPFVAESREHWLRVAAADLGRGVPLFTLAPGALVRINPAPGSAAAGAALDPGALVIVDEKGKTYAQGAGFSRLASAEQLAAAGMELPEGTLAFRLAPEVGSGRLTLRAEGLGGGEAFVVHVLDAGSSTVLRLGSTRAAYLDGQALVAELEARGDGARLALDEVTGFVTSPAGRAWPLRFRPSGSVYRASLRLDANEVAAPGLWEIHASASGRDAGRRFVRNARTAFACALPSARLSGHGELGSGKAGGLEVRLGVETASAGRYEVRGVLFGTAPGGGMKPIATAHGAAWLEAGGGTLALSFDGVALAASALTQPYEVRELELRDQGRMALLERRARGFVVRP